MDPTHAPDFQPPSTNPEIEPTLPPTLIPNRRPIQPPVLADYLNALDKPIEPSVSKHRLENKNNSSSCININSNNIKHMKHKIPKQPTELEPFSSSDEGDDNSNQRSNININNNNNSNIDLIEDSLLIDSESIISSPKVQSQHDDSISIPTPPTNHRTHSFLSDKGPKVHSYQIADLEEVPHGIQRQSKNLKDYSFPSHRLKQQMTTSNKFPLVIVACGSFSPITYLHLRMFEMALDAIREQTRFEVIGAYFSPVSDNYRKPGLASAHHRVRMCELACERTSSWLMVDAWESLQPKYTRTALVLDHFNEEINIKRNGILSKNGNSRLGVKIMLLAGGDLIESMGEPNVWAEQDLQHILGNYGCLIVERTGSDVRSFLLSHDIMYEHRKNILVIKQLIYNDISSTKVRLFLRRNMSVQYLLPNSVIRYIQEHGLYVDEKEPVKLVLNK
ncbi:Nicotinamide/nicotinic acid mononucleotide adenylyltransferase 1 [Pichia californica]|uniref:Nicotinamide-nucleotide adenylyltransferase n=1 Tax=Pichia californica TaxID=460514 RepID=A0A9P6WID5_9ASCO|nr:Nicotinamide/nicotinic acid mononucleotide adenylyltransferase 1 [[Candida] californica]